MVGPEQAAFISGRNIQENVMLSSEITRKYERKQISPRCTIKVDIKKAFDTINWEFIKAMLAYYGFSDGLSNLIMGCISSTTLSLCINGSLHGYFKAQKGLRQGDHISPYIFVLTMEILSRLLRDAANSDEFKWHPKCSRVKLSHLLFADDLLIFCRGDIKSVSKVLDTLKRFEEISGLGANALKTEIFLGELK